MPQTRPSPTDFRGRLVPKGPPGASSRRRPAATSPMHDEGKPMRSLGFATVVASGLLLWVTAVPAVAESVQADLVEQNHSGVHGTVTLTVTDAGDLRVRIRATGLVPGPHAQHLHGAAGGKHFACATMRSD